ncbi:TSC22 domain family protein 1 isoform X3 [Rana temporaria]|nr:TSC22 domain family protein 1 isoform X3 [Rana temporaria]
MHQPDPSADLSARKMAHPADVPRRGSGASPSPLTLTGGPGLGGGHLLSSEDYQQSPMLVQPPLPASSSSPGPQQHPPQTLNLMPQPGAQMMKKKSGFQITSVTPAQISANMSSNNSIAEDTESYDDLDESHTEDLSSSEILDVSLSRATDLGGPERSSSEETLNNFQEAETPGAVSPNQPHLHQPLPAHVQQNIMINGNVHHPHHLHHPHHHHHGLPTATHPGFPSAPLSGTSQNAAPIKLATQGSTDSAVNIGPASSAPSGPNVGTVPPLTRKASGPVSTGVNPVQGSSTSHNINIQNISVTGPLPTNVSSTNVTSSSNVSAVSGLNTNVSLSGNGGVASSNLPNNVSNAAVGSAPGSASVPQQAAPLAVTSRFRVVKLDSSTEPFKKGRWTCMEFYDKENTAAASEGAVVNKAVESVKQNPLEVTSERESTSGSSVSSNISTLSHYTESVGSGEMGAPAMQGFPTLAPQQMDFSNPLTQNVPASNIPQSVSQPQLAQLHIHSQDVTYSPQKQVGQATTTSINPAVGIQATAVGVQPATVNILGVASSLGHQQAAVPAMIPQQLPYPQQTQPIQTLPTVPQQQLQYAHQQTAPTQLTTGHVMPANQSSVPGNLPEYLQHPQMLQTAVGPVQSNSAAVGSTATVPVVQAQVLQAQMQSSSAQPPPTCVASTQPVVHAQTTLSATGSQVVGVAQQGSLPVHQASAGQASPPVMQQNVPTPSQQVLPPAQGIQVAASAHPQPVMIAPQNPLLPSMPPTQLLEPALQGMATQQVPAVSPIPAATNVSAVPQLNTGIPPGISPATTTLGPPPTVTQLSTAQNGNLVQSGSQAPLMSALPIAQNVALQMAAGPGQFLVTSLVQSVASQIEDARRLEQSMAGLPHAGEGAMLDSSGNLQGPGSLLPLKSLPLTTPLVDGEDDR